MSGWPGPVQPGANAADLLQLLAAIGRMGQDGRGGLGPAPGASAHSAQPSVTASSAFHAYQRGPPSGGTDLLSALQFWSELYQIAQNGLKNAMAQVAAAYPALAGGLAGLAPTQSPTASAAMQLLSSRGLAPPAPLPAAHSDMSAVTAVLAAAAGLPGAASSASVPPLPDALLAAAGLLTNGAAAAAAAPAPRGNSAGAAAPDSQGAGAAKRDWSVDPGASDGSQELQRKRPRVEGSQPTSHRVSSSGKICSNCHTSNTPFWRKDRHTGLPLCNACGLYAAKNDHPRPVKLWREGQSGSPTQTPRQHAPQQQTHAPQQQAPSQQQAPQQHHAHQQQAAQQQQQRSPPPSLPACVPPPNAGQVQQERAASPNSIAVAAAMQAVMKQAAAQHPQRQQPGSGSVSPQQCGSPAARAPQQAQDLQSQSLPPPQVSKDEPQGSPSPSSPGTAGQAPVRSLPQPGPLPEGLKQAPSAYREAAASLLAATMGVLAQPS